MNSRHTFYAEGERGNYIHYTGDAINVGPLYVHKFVSVLDWNAEIALA